MTINTLYELVRNSVEKFASKVAFSMFEGDDVTYAHADAIDSDAALLVTLPDGTKSTIASGEVSVRGMYGYV